MKSKKTKGGAGSTSPGSAGPWIFLPMTEREMKGADMGKFWLKNRTPAQRARLCRKECGGVETCPCSDACINWPSAAQQEWLSANVALTGADGVTCSGLVGDLRRQVEAMRRIADDTESSLNEGDPVRRAFYYGRCCCLREQAMNIEDIIANAESEVLT